MLLFKIVSTCLRNSSCLLILESYHIRSSFSSKNNQCISIDRHKLQMSLILAMRGYCLLIFLIGSYKPSFYTLSGRLFAALVWSGLRDTKRLLYRNKCWILKFSRNHGSGTSFDISKRSFGRNGMVSIPGTVRKQTTMKNILYPTTCCSQPLTNPGNIMPSAIIPVEIA